MVSRVEGLQQRGEESSGKKSWQARTLLGWSVEVEAVLATKLKSLREEFSNRNFRVAYVYYHNISKW